MGTGAEAAGAGLIGSDPPVKGAGALHNVAEGACQWCLLPP